MTTTAKCSPFDRGRRCDPATIDYTAAGARCSACGAFWPLSRTDKGHPIGYITPPVSRRIVAS